MEEGEGTAPVYSLPGVPQLTIQVPRGGGRKRGETKKGRGGVTRHSRCWHARFGGHPFESPLCFLSSPPVVRRDDGAFNHGAHDRHKAPMPDLLFSLRINKREREGEGRGEEGRVGESKGESKGESEGRTGRYCGSAFPHVLR